MHEYPYWWDTVPALRAGSEKLEVRSQKVDVAIVGAGYTGLAAARSLARAGASVTVFDREHAGWGASSRNGGQVLTGLRPDPATLVRRHGERRARELFETSREAIAHLEATIAEERIDCEYERRGHIHAAWKPSHFTALRDEQALLARVFDHRVEIVGRADQRIELGTDRYHGLLVDEQSAALNPARYVAGLAEAAARAGACLAEKTAVERVEKQGSRWHVGTSSGTVDAGDVLIATDGYTSAISPDLNRRLVSVGSYIIATERLESTLAARLLPRRRVAFDSKNFLYYFRLSTDRRLLFGGRAEFSRPTEQSARHAAGILKRGMVEVFPELRGTRIEYAWGGAVGFTRDQMPHAGQMGGQYYAVGYGGHGIAMATYLGDRLARWMAGDTVPHPLIGDQFPTIPMANGRPWLLPLVGAYYTVMDWLT